LAGLVTGTAVAAVALLLRHGDGSWLGVVVGVAMTMSLTVGCLWGVVIPLLMNRLGFDPAQSATSRPR
jgi:magnesium transporter